ncbi:MAG TPA: hypothetical protein VFD91_09095 [Mariniphaga sp.]|nr:hypothetical protein [Mariniphaga sp.]
MRKNNLILISILLILFACIQDKNEELTSYENQFDSLNQKDNKSIIENEEYMDFKIKEYQKKIRQAKTKLIGKWRLVENKTKTELVTYEDSDITVEFIDNSTVILNGAISCSYDFSVGGVLELIDCDYKNTWWKRQLRLSHITNEYLHLIEKVSAPSMETFNSILKFKKMKDIE